MDYCEQIWMYGAVFILVCTLISGAIMLCSICCYCKHSRQCRQVVVQRAVVVHEQVPQNHYQAMPQQQMYYAPVPQQVNYATPVLQQANPNIGQQINITGNTGHQQVNLGGQNGYYR